RERLALALPHVSRAIKRFKLPGLAKLQNDLPTRDPIPALAVNQMGDYLGRAPRAFSFLQNVHASGRSRKKALRAAGVRERNYWHGASDGISRRAGGASRRLSHKSRFTALLMQEVADAGEDHAEAPAVCGGNHVRVADRTARLNDRGRTGFGCFLDAIGKRKKCIGGD